MGDETQAALMKALRDLQEEMKNMRQELGGRMDRIEHWPVIRPQRRADFGTAQANTTPTGTAPRRTGIHFNDIPEASNTHQQPEDDPGPFYPQNQNQRRTEEQDEYGEEDEEEEDFLPRPRAPRRQNCNQGRARIAEGRCGTTASRAKRRLWVGSAFRVSVVKFDGRFHLWLVGSHRRGKGAEFRAGGGRVAVSVQGWLSHLPRPRVHAGSQEEPTPQPTFQELVEHITLIFGTGCWFFKGILGLGFFDVLGPELYPSFLVVECSGLRGGLLRVVELSHPTVVEITTMYSRTGVPKRAVEMFEATKQSGGCKNDENEERDER
ncbi:hypothetical protein F2Q70_00037199 [Brassica cretica]|uniref:Uncharacterized protein n=1 Tax=Brassica cretica TaxID=69181 RepID=A0A8S9JP02_BRACR|nr:hypothetical protein F2Q70_00037199 [Brassica cretica]